MNIKNRTVERLAAEVAHRMGVSKTEAVRQALAAQLARLPTTGDGDRSQRLTAFLERDVWPTVPHDVLGRRLEKAEREAILGYGEEGV